MDDKDYPPDEIESLLSKALRRRFMSPLYTNYAVSRNAQQKGSQTA